MDIKLQTSNEKSKTYLIVGQGIAGTLLTHFLLKADQNVLVIDNHHLGSSSQAAAGIINPITGRRYVKSWRVDELLPFAKQTYHELEDLLQIKFYFDRNVIRTFAHAKEENDWLLHSIEPGYQKYVADRADIGNYKGKTTPTFGYGEVLHGAQVDLPILIKSFREGLEKQGRVVEEEAFDFEQLIIEELGIRYKNITADVIIFCEGAKAKENPYFNYLPFHGDKGEALVVHIPNAGFEKILKQHLFIVPLERRDRLLKSAMPDQPATPYQDLYWVGTTNQARYTDDFPSEEGKNYLLKHLQNLLTIPFEVVDHLAAVRPTVRDRRPFLGLHPEFPQLAIFNGLGTKGASLAPFFAQHFMRFTINKTPLDREVDIQRFVE